VLLLIIWRNYFPIYGTPKPIVSDNARVFSCKAFKDLCFRRGVEHITTMPYYPQASLAERVNRNLKSALKIFHSESQEKWDEDLPCLSLAFNTAVHESTGSTPDRLFLGLEMKCPLGVQWDLMSLNEERLTGMTQNFWTQAYRNLKRACCKVARRYNLGRNPHTFQIGDRVVFRLNTVSSKANQTTSRMQMRWSPPMVIQRMLRSNVVLLANPDTGLITRRAHVTQLKPCIK
jgi:hypothetical protein